MAPKKRILFVCTGNTCRSPMAEALARRYLGDDQVDVFSAGLFAIEGENASPEAQLVLEEEGIDLSGHRARILTQEMLDQSDLILTMTRAHKKMLLSLYPEHGQKVWTLKGWVASLKGEAIDIDNEDIPDPFGYDVSVYAKTRDELKTLILDVQNIQKKHGEWKSEAEA
ncbi:MAG: low molecular weight protein arginine phosphatase [Candidatus Carbobacillus altaicus]|nr:low molecular weight protein arginine phosphatase [Candidatus Carbobacillus altaicus]